MSKNLYIDLHVIQTLPPSCVNRDDTGSPKTAIYGGVTRARVSSQSWKRAMRLMFADMYTEEEKGIRTKKIVDLLAKKISELDSEIQSAEKLAKKVLEAAGIKLTEKNGKAELQLYFHGAAEGRKADALKSQSPVAVEMDCRHGIITGDYTCAYSYSYRSIMGNGTVTLLETFEEKEKGLQRIMEHMAPGAKIEFRPEMLTRTAVWQINVYEFTGKERKAK